MVTIKHRFQLLGVLETNRLPYMLDHLGHIKRNDEAALEIVVNEQCRSDADSIRTDELLNQPHQLGHQECLTTPPVRLHLVVNIPSGFEDDPLSSEFLRQFFQINSPDFRDIRLALDNRGEFRNFGCPAGVEFQGFQLLPIQR